MKSTDLIPLNSTVTAVNAKGQAVRAPETRTVLEEIERLEHAGMNGPAQKLRNACDDLQDPDHPVIDPVTGKGYVHAPRSAEEIAADKDTAVERAAQDAEAEAEEAIERAKALRAAAKAKRSKKA